MRTVKPVMIRATGESQPGRPDGPENQELSGVAAVGRVPMAAVANAQHTTRHSINGGSAAIASDRSDSVVGAEELRANPHWPEVEHSSTDLSRSRYRSQACANITAKSRHNVGDAKNGSARFSGAPLRTKS